MIMRDAVKLKTIKLIHTAVWIFYNIVIFYMLYAAIRGRIGGMLWTGYALVVLEGIILAIFGFVCPLTLLARKYSASTKANFDIYLPEWLAKHTKVIYTVLVGLITLIVVIRLSGVAR